LQATKISIDAALICLDSYNTVQLGTIMNPEGYWFKSSKFEIELGEDADINPRIYGRQLAVCLKARLEQNGYAVENIINEDWGRCLMCQRDPFMLWVGCGNMSDHRTAKPAESGLSVASADPHQLLLNLRTSSRSRSASRFPSRV
jgi:hypothetical protein